MVDKDKIRNILGTYYSVNMKQVVIHEDGVVDVYGDVRCRATISSLMVQFGKIKGDFNCSMIGITSLKGAPNEVGGDFFCIRNQLTSLEYAPMVVHGGFWCSKNQLTSLVGAPINVPGDFYCYNNPLKSLEGLPNHIGGTVVVDYSRHLPLLRCLVAHSVNIYGAPPDLGDIMNDERWIGKGKKGSLMCAAALIRAGFEGNAKW